MKGQITLEHGSGGKLSHELVREVFFKYFDNIILEKESDSAVLQLESGNIAFTTDSFVVSPIFFPDGNIGKLAVCGTVNDLAVSGATPLYISAAFIIEEGFPVSELEDIVASMASEAANAGVKIVAGDTKVVNKGQCDKIFITTTGLGIISEKYKHIATGEKIKKGDKIIINGSIAEHGLAIMIARNFQEFKSDINSDCACLNLLIKELLENGCEIKFMRDVTRGGLATVLCEIGEKLNIDITIEESAIPINENVKGMCEVFGFDPLYIANEGKVIIICSENDTEKAINIMKKNKYGLNSSIIGEVTSVDTKEKGKVILNTIIGGSRIVNMLTGELIPRIC